MSINWPIIHEKSSAAYSMYIVYRNDNTYTDSSGHVHLLPADFYKNFVGHPAIVSEVIEHVYGGFIH